MIEKSLKEVLSWQLKQLKAVTLLIPSTLASVEGGYTIPPVGGGGVEGGKVDWGRLLSGASGVAEGIYFCAASGAPLFTLASYAIVGCGVVGAGLGYAFPH